jgi:hypothetical protein
VEIEPLALTVPSTVPICGLSAPTTDSCWTIGLPAAGIVQPLQPKVAVWEVHADPAAPQDSVMEPPVGGVAEGSVTIWGVPFTVTVICPLYLALVNVIVPTFVQSEP